MGADYVELESWGAALRSMRANRPNFAASGARARTFGAGLEQAEQLWRASEVVESVASPLLLFYGLTQAGRAVCAAGTPGNSWEGAQRHGLAFRFSPPADGAHLNLTTVIVSPNGSGLVHQVANILHSPVLNSSVSLSDLIASLDSDLLFDDSQIPHPRPLEVYENGDPGELFAADARQSLFLGPVPEHFASNREAIPPGPHNLAYTRIISPPGEPIAEWLAAYPTLRALGVPTSVDGPEPSGGRIDSGDWVIRLAWDGGTRISGLNQSEWTARQLDVVYGDDTNATYGVVLPAVAGNNEAQDLLICWWLILYCLSMLARYYPTAWTEMLDVDTSLLAVPLDHLISVARSKVPTLLYRVLHNLRTAQQTP